MNIKTFIPLILILQSTAIASADLSPTVQEWVDITLSRFGEAWDEEAGMLGNSNGHGTRGTMFHALGLLQRGREEDRERACKAIRSVCKQQFIAPTRKYHGTFSRSDKDKPPEDVAFQWKDYDPNWREFIGLSMILAIELCGEALDKTTQDIMLEALRHACEGAYERNVKWSYTNISLMSALLLSWGGRQFDNSDWKARGETLAQEIYENFKKHNTFWEYNSPTYYGTDLWALAAWRVIGPTPDIVAMGTTMEADLWRDIAQSYHAGMGNMCGPYDRSYGMDMQRYFSITGIAIALTAESTVSIPDVNTGKKHFHDLAFLPLLALLGLQPPEDVLLHLKSFQGKRDYARIIESGKTERKAYFFLNDTCMIGIETNSRVVRSSTQYHPFTVHWKGASGEINWIRLIGDTPVIVSLKDRIVEIEFASSETNSQLIFEVYAPTAQEIAFTADGWYLPDLTLKTVQTPSIPKVTKDNGHFMVCYEATKEKEPTLLHIDITTIR